MVDRSCTMIRRTQPDARRAATEVPRNSGHPPSPLRWCIPGTYERSVAERRDLRGDLLADDGVTNGVGADVVRSQRHGDHVDCYVDQILCNRVIGASVPLTAWLYSRSLRPVENVNIRRAGRRGSAWGPPTPRPPQCQGGAVRRSPLLSGVILRPARR